MKHYILYTIITLIFLTNLTVSPAHAQQQKVCQPLYGGGQTCNETNNIIVNKEIKEADSSNFEDNLSTPMAYFAPGSNITFRITIQNKTDSVLTNITITDIIPSYLTYKNSNGTFDKNSSTFTTKIDSLSQKQNKVFTINTVVNSKNLPDTPNPLCVVNQAVAVENGKNAVDNAVFCINNRTGVKAPTPAARTTTLSKISPTAKPTSKTPQPTNKQTTKGGLPVYKQPTPTTTPSTGPEMLGLLSLPSLAGLGYLLRNSRK